MKKYFTKYLPVDGEIKEGDLFVLKDIPNTKVKQAEVGWNSNLILTSIQKVKLFLCSRDIQVGDLCRTTHRPSSEFRYGIDAQIGGMSDGDCTFKVVGEVSPDAVWVKEGMEFNEEDVKKLVEIEEYYAGREEQFQSFERMYPVEATLENLPNQPSYYRKVYAEKLVFKCPTCDNFH